MSASAGQTSQDGSGSINWLAVHLLSAEEVKALFSDVVSGLAFLVSHLEQNASCLVRNFSPAWSVNIASGSETWKCAPYVGAGQVNVRR